MALFYPTFASAAEASGISRIWGGIHWPADNEQGQILGRKIGETVWGRVEQFLLGTASPADAVVTALRPPFWFADGGRMDSPHSTAADGATNGSPPDTRGIWRSIAVDPVPAGTYELKLAVKVMGDGPVHVRVAVETPDIREELLGKASAVASAGTAYDARRAVDKRWSSIVAVLRRGSDRSRQCRRAHRRFAQHTDLARRRRIGPIL